MVIFVLLLLLFFCIPCINFFIVKKTKQFYGGVQHFAYAQTVYTFFGEGPGYEAKSMPKSKLAKLP